MNSELSVVKAEPSICDTEFDWDTDKNIMEFCDSLKNLSNRMTRFKASFLSFVDNADSIFFKNILLKLNLKMIIYNHYSIYKLSFIKKFIKILILQKVNK